MRIKILLLGDDPVSLLADSQLLSDRGLMVFTSFNMENISETIYEIKPDIVFFDPQKPANIITDAYNTMVNGFEHTQIPVIFTLADDDVYLITRKRTMMKSKRSLIADNIVSAVKMALSTDKPVGRKAARIAHPGIAGIPNVSARA